MLPCEDPSTELELRPCEVVTGCAWYRTGIEVEDEEKVRIPNCLNTQLIAKIDEPLAKFSLIQFVLLYDWPQMLEHVGRAMIQRFLKTPHSSKNSRKNL
ncbi:unnamed protein product [Acanthoscelides obtectus]|uniref:Uncharacterized protein n=1 Tax=Acanthoscelides obtectus TaxID=200917 RepID=A0A9P0KHA9_ACAOB|nr:unnamed protein product [Acanthoscelides obtectus]CAK1632507.1 hypothetical protein AOBTE_LOCUS7604 [Acanthoscelides obtectus]